MADAPAFARRQRASTITIDTSAVNKNDSSGPAFYEKWIRHFLAKSAAATERNTGLVFSDSRDDGRINVTKSHYRAALTAELDKVKSVEMSSQQSLEHHHDFSSTNSFDVKDRPMARSAHDAGTEEDFVRAPNKFAFTPGMLNKLINPKSLAAFYHLGGLPGSEKGRISGRLRELKEDGLALSGPSKRESGRSVRQGCEDEVYEPAVTAKGLRNPPTDTLILWDNMNLDSELHYGANFDGDGDMRRTENARINNVVGGLKGMRSAYERNTNHEYIYSSDSETSKSRHDTAMACIPGPRWLQPPTHEFGDIGCRYQLRTGEKDKHAPRLGRTYRGNRHPFDGNPKNQSQHAHSDLMMTKQPHTTLIISEGLEAEVKAILPSLISYDRPRTYRDEQYSRPSSSERPVPSTHIPPLDLPSDAADESSHQCYCHSSDENPPSRRSTTFVDLQVSAERPESPFFMSADATCMMSGGRQSPCLSVADYWSGDGDRILQNAVGIQTGHGPPHSSYSTSSSLPQSGNIQHRAPPNPYPAPRYASPPNTPPSRHRGPPIQTPRGFPDRLHSTTTLSWITAAFIILFTLSLAFAFLLGFLEAKPTFASTSPFPSWFTSDVLYSAATASTLILNSIYTMLLIHGQRKANSLSSRRGNFWMATTCSLGVCGAALGSIFVAAKSRNGGNFVSGCGGAILSYVIHIGMKVAGEEDRLSERFELEA